MFTVEFLSNNNISIQPIGVCRFSQMTGDHSMVEKCGFGWNLLTSPFQLCIVYMRELKLPCLPTTIVYYLSCLHRFNYDEDFARVFDSKCYS